MAVRNGKTTGFSAYISKPNSTGNESTPKDEILARKKSLIDE